MSVTYNPVATKGFGISDYMFLGQVVLGVIFVLLLSGVAVAQCVMVFGAWPVTVTLGAFVLGMAVVAAFTLSQLRG